MLKKLIIIGMLTALFGCGDKNNAITPQEAPKPAVSSQSIFNDAEINFSAEEMENLSFKNPQKSLEKINEQMTIAEQAQKDMTAFLALRSLVQSQLGNNGEAFDDMTKAVQLRPNAELYALRALVLWRSGKLRGAMNDAEYALLKDKNISLGHMAQGLVWLEENEMSKACSALKSACDAGQCFGLEHANKQGKCN